ncbi:MULTISPECIES: mandelate racemase/muconate lactonizing enzyme family protein [unclassified Labrenzia]|uniref:mandelate racemase/muconate lactonizing enzyme family protein n=1 Tax=unclassified Labrenzia TaxID=2648686 RepID=UPI0015673738|nr:MULTISPECIES: mandelate racemase/muconate lactonizing enzyme family protein [unclassified Labrenzia]
MSALAADERARVVAVRHWLVGVPLKNPILWATGVRSRVTRMLVEVETASGIKGYGETICLLDYIPAVFETVVKPLLLDRPVHDTERLFRHVLGAGYYHHQRAAVYAAAAAEMAMWDAVGKFAGLPLHRLWGGAYRSDIEIASYLFISSPEELAKLARTDYDAGYRSFKIKIGLDPQQDLALVKAIREELGPHAHIRADVNGAWTIGTAKRMLEMLKPYDLAYVEQPLELTDLAGHAELRQSQPIPIALDESAYTLQEVANIVANRAADVVLLDPHQAGGLKQVLKAAGLCEAYGIPVTLHSGGELGLSQAAYLHVAAACPNMILAIDNELPYLSGDILKVPFRIENGHLRVPEAPGLGVEIDLDAIARFEVDRIEGAYLDPRRPDWFPQKPAY